MAAPYFNRKGNVSVRLFDGALNSMFEPGGEVYKENGKIVREIALLSAVLSPKRTGTLSRSHKANVTPGNFNKRTTGQLWTAVEHAQYVIFGTGGPTARITSNRPGGLLLVRLAPHSWYRTPNYVSKGRKKVGYLRKWVAGQRANNYIQRAADTVLARYR